ncbi:MAG: peptidoglycan DD-metalloendopeptidase family protein, partial [Chloroflexia bacterium]|nr:peptidoglycan DD-metalloendopeptidase family protein [Chloroflexia bacterium]
MTTACSTPSITRRIQTYALAGTLAAGLLFPVAQVAQADSTASPPDSQSGLTISVETVDQLSGLTAIVDGGEADVYLRAEPFDESESLAVVADGTTVDLRVDVLDTVYDSFGVRWWPATLDGADGWISGQYLTQATTADGVIVSSRLVAFDYTGQATAHSTAKVFGNGQNVNVRAEPSSTGEIVTKAAHGEVISLRIDLADTVYDDAGTRWWPVTVNGLDGWISGFYLMSSDDASPTSPETPSATMAPDVTPGATVPGGMTPEPTAAPTGEAAPGFAAGDFLQVFTGTGEGLNARASGSPTAEVTGEFADGEIVLVVSGPVSFESSEAGWYEVTNNNATGFVDGDLLITSVEAAATSTPPSTEPPLSEEEEATVAATTQPTSAATEDTTVEPTTAATVDPTQEPEPTAAPTDEPSSGFIYPLADYTRTQAFGCSNLGFYSFNEDYGCPLHDGLDLAAPSGTPILAAGSGTVVTAGWCNCGLGYYVEIDHGDGITTLYGHMASQPYVSAGETVSQGEVIGPVGSTGISTGPHTHFMVRVNGVAQNPENYLP